MAVLGALGAIVGAVILGILANELYAWLPVSAVSLVIFAVRRLPKEKQNRYSEEWRSHLNDIPGGLSKVVFAIGLQIAARQICRDLGCRMPSHVALGIKRAVDISMVILASPVLLVLFLLITVLIRVTSPGPVLFAGRRLLGNGRFFTILRFRTMFMNSAEVLEDHLTRSPEARTEWRRSHKWAVDPRVTQFGRLLRKTSLDEIPLFLNVLAGTMSLVGPRPIMPSEIQNLGEGFEGYRGFKPGLIGLWDISADKDSSNSEQRNQFDTEYVANWSLKRDLIIMMKACFK